MFSIVVVSFNIFTNNVQGVYFCHLLANTYYFIVVILMALKRALIDLIFKFLISNAEHLCMFLAICASSLKKCLFKPIFYWVLCCCWLVGRFFTKSLRLGWNFLFFFFFTLQTPFLFWLKSFRGTNIWYIHVIRTINHWNFRW